MLEELDDLLESGEVIACQAVCTLADGYQHEMTIVAPP